MSYLPDFTINFFKTRVTLDSKELIRLKRWWRVLLSDQNRHMSSWWRRGYEDYLDPYYAAWTLNYIYGDCWRFTCKWWLNKPTIQCTTKRVDFLNFFLIFSKSLYFKSFCPEKLLWKLKKISKLIQNCPKSYSKDKSWFLKIFTVGLFSETSPCFKKWGQ